MDAAFLRFLISVMGLWGVLHAYVFWRLSTLPWIEGFVPNGVLIGAAVALWASYVATRVLDARGRVRRARLMEPLAATWIGVFFLLFGALLLVDFITVGGLLGESFAIDLRTGAVVIALVFACVGMVQAARSPVVRKMEVPLPGLPCEHDDISLVLISDLHLGNLLGPEWLSAIIEQIAKLEPDIVAVAGDLADHDIERVEKMLPQLSQLRAPLGVWAVTGNHDAYAGLSRVHALMGAAGFRVLADGCAEVVPGLTIAGVDDLSVPRETRAEAVHPITKALEQASPGAVILLSHTPLDIELAAEKGAGLTLCGHTHGGQLWPFGLLVQLRYRFLGGLYHVGRMPLIVCRGTGTWGPRMRLWRPSEMWHLRLRSHPANH